MKYQRPFRDTHRLAESFSSACESYARSALYAHNWTQRLLKDRMSIAS
jgi:hypothetical protein